MDARLPHDLNAEQIVGFLRERAYDMGFNGLGVSPAEELHEDGKKLDAWLYAGSAGEMGYMHNHRALRTNASVLHPGAKTVVSLTTPYQPLSLKGRNARIAAYAHGVDYHELLRDKLQSLLEALEAFVGFPVHGRAITDSAPLLERASARRAGLGWVGRSAMLIHPDRGTYTILSEMLIDLELRENTEEVRNHCGTCHRCVDACPTGAIRGDGTIDAKKCISYLTIELKTSIPRKLRTPIGEQMFGCDICQAVCPWNRFADNVQMEELAPRSELDVLDATDVLQLSRQDFNTLFKGTAIHRTKRRGLGRNAAIVLGNRKDPTTIPLLIQTLHHHDEPLVREHTIWALAQFLQDTSVETETIHQALRLAFVQDSDPGVQKEILWAREEFGF